LAFSRNPAELERRAAQIRNVAALIKDPLAYDEALAKAQALLDEAARLRRADATSAELTPGNRQG
jgi:hypothetical protein